MANKLVIKILIGVITCLIFFMQTVHAQENGKIKISVNYQYQQELFGFNDYSVYDAAALENEALSGMNLKFIFPWKPRLEVLVGSFLFTGDNFASYTSSPTPTEAQVVYLQGGGIYSGPLVYLIKTKYLYLTTHIAGGLTVVDDRRLYIKRGITHYDKESKFTTAGMNTGLNMSLNISRVFVNAGLFLSLTAGRESAVNTYGGEVGVGVRL